MGFTPARMSRILVGGHQSQLETVIQALHAEGVVHLEDYQDPTGTTRIGTPLPRGDQVSSLLVRLRGLQKALGLDTHTAVAGKGHAEVHTLSHAESAAQPVLDEANRLKAELALLEATRAALTPLSGLDVDTALVGNLKAIRLTVGTTRMDPRAAFANARLSGEVDAVPSSSGFAVAVAVVPKDAAAADKILAEHGFSPAQVPAGAGTPAARLAQLATEQGRLEAALAATDAKLAQLRTQWGAQLASLEAHLVGEVERTQAPLQFGVTQTTFHLEGWVPADHVQALQATLTSKFGQKLYVEVFGDAPEPHGHGAHPGNSKSDGHNGHAAAAGASATLHSAAAHGGHGEHGHADAVGAGHQGHDHGHDKAGDGHGHAHGPEHDPPVKLENPAAVRPYEWILGLLARPRYKEVDPSKLMLVFFPLFFGLMVGDVVTGILIALFGQWLKSNKFIGIGGPAVGKAIQAGGIMAIILGAFLFGEAMGIHFVVSPEQQAEGDMSWESILGLHIPFETEAHGFLYKTGAPGLHEALDAGAASGTVLEGSNTTVGAADAALHTAAESTTEVHGILSPHSHTHLSLGGIVNLGYYSKLHDVQALMVIALGIAVVHITLGLALGFRNVMKGHGAALAIQEKGAFITFLAGVAIAVLGATTPAILWVGVGIAAVSIVLLWMGAAKVYGAGYVAILELPGLAGNFVSYTRLAAIGAAEGGLGLAVLTICFKTLPGGAVGWVLYTIAFCALCLLSILSGGLQSLRLQFVEFFGKFFEGGGRPYVPFGRRAA